MKKTLPFLFCFVLASLVAAAENGAYLLAVKPGVGQSLIYDGSYVLKVPGDKGVKDMVISSASFDLVLTIDAVDSQGAIISSKYTRFVYRAQTGKTVNALAEGLQFRLLPDGRIQLISGNARSASWQAAQNIWTGWPVHPISVGASWKTEGQSAMAGGSISFHREYKFDEIVINSGHTLAVLSYAENAVLTGTKVRSTGGQATMDSAIIGVGEVKLDLTAGVVAAVVSISTMTGKITDNRGAGSALSLQAETTLNLRAVTAR